MHSQVARGTRMGAIPPLETARQRLRGSKRKSPGRNASEPRRSAVSVYLPPGGEFREGRTARRSVKAATERREGMSTRCGRWRDRASRAGLSFARAGAREHRSASLALQGWHGEKVVQGKSGGPEASRAPPGNPLHKEHPKGVGMRFGESEGTIVLVRVGTAQPHRREGSLLWPRCSCKEALARVPGRGKPCP